MLKILCIIQTPVPSTEISIIRPLSYLQKEQEITWQLVKEAAFSPELLHEVDVVVFHRNCSPGCLPILEAVKALKIPIIYEVDDNYLDMPEDLPIGRYMRSPRVVHTVESLLYSASVVKIGSPELIPLFAKYNRHIIYHPYAVDLSILDNVSVCDNSFITIGYAGTIHHCMDFQYVIEPMRRIAKEFPQVHWEFIGCLPGRTDTLPNCSFTPFIPDYQVFLQDLYQRSWQIGLAPLLDIPHNRCKTDNKLREYGACRIAGIYSDMPPYSTNVQDGKTGLLAANTEQSWYKAIKTLITDNSLRKRLITQARHWVEECRSIPLIAKLWIELFNLSRQEMRVEK